MLKKRRLLGTNVLITYRGPVAYLTVKMTEYSCNTLCIYGFINKLSVAQNM
jgi:hypothetical protein